MYESYWGLQEKPFENTPDPRYLYQSADGAEVYERLQYAINSNRGAALLTGESGCGKTLMARALLQQLDADRTEIALLNNPCSTAEEFLREVLYQLGEDGPPEGRTQAIHRIHEILYEFYEAGKETVIFIDEGQLLEDSAILEEIRLLLNFQLNDAFLVTLLLAGQPALRERIRKYSPLDQRMATRGVLRPFGPEECHGYIAHRLETAGRVEEIFTADAIDLVYEYSAGVPRKLNNICDIALVIGFSRKLEKIDVEAMARLIQAERGDQ